MSHPLAVNPNNGATVLDASGLPMRHSMARDASHVAGQTFRQEMISWTPRLGSHDSHWLPDRDLATARVRDLIRNNGWSSGLVTRHIDQIIGSQFHWSPRPDYHALGLSFEWALEWAQIVAAKWREFTLDPRKYIDSTGRFTWPLLAGAAFRHRLVDGEALTLLNFKRRSDTPWRTALRVIHPDRLSNPDGRANGSSLRGGIELSADGEPIRYHIRTRHPGDGLLAGADDLMTWNAIPARHSWGRPRMIHFFEPEDIEQHRGKSLLTPVVEKLKMLDHYDRVELQAAVVNAVFAAYIESPFDHDLVNGALEADTKEVEGYQKQRKEFHGDRGISMEGARIPTLFPGEKIGTIDPARPNVNAATFEQNALRFIAAATGQSYEELAQDWTKTNYSSARAGMLNTWKFGFARRGHFGEGWGTPIALAFLEDGFDNGEIPFPKGAPSLFEAPAAWTRGRWIGPGRGYVDPTKEAQAALMRMDAGLSTLQDENADQGADWRETLDQQAAEQAYRSKLGLPATTWAVISENNPLSHEEDADDRDHRETQEQNR